MLFKALSAAVFGIDAYLVEVEVDVGSGRMGDFNVVGLPDIAVKESRERIKAALKNCGFDFPYPQGVTVNLAPADIRKEGSAFDLPMALGILGCQGTFFGKPLSGYVFLGELSLDGSVRPCAARSPPRCASREQGIRAPGRAGSQCPRSSRRRRRGSLRHQIAAASRGSGERAGIVRAGEDRCADACWPKRRSIPSICATSAASRAPNAPWKSPAPEATTLFFSGRPAPEKPCWPSASPRSCRRCRSRRPSRPRASTA